MAENEIKLKVEFSGGEAAREENLRPYQIPFSPHSEATKRRLSNQRQSDAAYERGLSQEQLAQMQQFGLPLPQEHIFREAREDAARKSAERAQRAFDETRRLKETISRRFRSGYFPDAPDFGAIPRVIDAEAVEQPRPPRSPFAAGLRRGASHARMARSIPGIAWAGGRGFAEGMLATAASQAAAGTLTGAAALSVGAVTAGLGALATAATAAAAALFEIPRLAEVNAPVAMATAMRDVRDIMGRIRRGERFGEEAGQFITATSEFSQAFKDLGAEILKDVLPVVVDILEILRDGLRFLTMLYKLWKEYASFVTTSTDLLKSSLDQIQKWIRALYEFFVGNPDAEAEARLNEIFDFFDPRQVNRFVPESARGF